MNGFFGVLILSVLLTTAKSVVGATFEVGPGRPLAQISDVPWESLQPGDTVLIHWRREPYREKWVIGCSGTAESPIRVQGIPSKDGALPVIDGKGARTRPQLSYWNEDRGIIKIGGAHGAGGGVARFITIENLDVQGARPPHSFVNTNGATQRYRAVAAAIYIERGEHIVIRNCSIHDSGNGLFVSSGDRETSKDILVERNHIYDNGNAGSQSEHNSYTAAAGIVFQFNHFGPLRAGCPGINLKDRSAGTLVRYNWMEGGNVQLSLVEAEDSRLIRGDPRYRKTFVYGNVLVEPQGDGIGLMVRYGGDSRKPELFRKGTLFFYNNTVVSRRTDRTTLFKLATDEERCDFRNNIVYTTSPGKNLRLAEAHGVFALSHNWLKSGWKAGGRVADDGTTQTGESPAFVDETQQEFRLASGSPCINTGGPIPDNAWPANDVTEEYAKHQGATARLKKVRLDRGAFGFVKDR